eukprot:5846800-Prymnesium_polylepis.1
MTRDRAGHRTGARRAAGLPSHLSHSQGRLAAREADAGSPRRCSRRAARRQGDRLAKIVQIRGLLLRPIGATVAIRRIELLLQLESRLPLELQFRSHPRE